MTKNDDDDASDEGAEDWELSDDDLIDSDGWSEDMTAEEAFAKKIDNDKKAYRVLKSFGITTPRTRGDLEPGERESLMSSSRLRNLPPFASPRCGARYEEMLVVLQPIQMVLAPTV